MTPPGVGPDRCRGALSRYRELAADLARLLRADASERQFGDALAVLDDLMVSLEVDTLTRRGGSGRYRVSTVEAECFVPAVTRVHRRLVALSTRRPSGDWLPALGEIDEELAAAGRRIDALDMAAAKGDAGAVTIPGVSRGS